MTNKDAEILTLWKTLTESEKEEVLRQLHEKLSPRVHIELREGIICMVM